MPNKLFHLERLTACGRWLNHLRARFQKLFKHLNAQKTIDQDFQRYLPVSLLWDTPSAGLGSSALFVAWLELLLQSEKEVSISQVWFTPSAKGQRGSCIPPRLLYFVAALNASFDSARIVKIHIFTRLCCLQFAMWGLFWCAMKFLMPIFRLAVSRGTAQTHWMEQAGSKVLVWFLMAWINPTSGMWHPSIHPCFPLPAVGTEDRHALQGVLGVHRLPHFLSKWWQCSRRYDVTDSGGLHKKGDISPPAVIVWLLLAEVLVLSWCNSDVNCSFTALLPLVTVWATSLLVARCKWSSCPTKVLHPARTLKISVKEECSSTSKTSLTSGGVGKSTSGYEACVTLNPYWVLRVQSPEAAQEQGGCRNNIWVVKCSRMKGILMAKFFVLLAGPPAVLIKYWLTMFIHIRFIIVRLIPNLDLLCEKMKRNQSCCQSKLIS